jgi:histidinol-phosphate aminotransferase
MRAVIRDEIATLSAYHVQDATGFIKLDAMENPFDFPAELRAPLAAQLANAAINRYPDASAATLTTSIRRAMLIPDSLDILLGNGSDEIIQIIAMAVAKPNAKLLSIEPAFVMFKMIATFCGLRYVGVPLAPDFAIDRDATLAAIKTHQPAVIFLAYPNNPTGNLFDDDVIDEIIRAAEGLVVIDEAYFAFSSRTFLMKLHLYPNVVLMRTVSKLGLAGLRLGMLIGDKKWLSQFDKVRLPYNINVLTQIAATFALDNIDAFTAQTNVLIEERAKMAASIDAIFANHTDAKRFESEANFILIRLPSTHQATNIFNHLRAQKILVKNTSASHPLLANTLRITIGAPDENQAFLHELDKVLAS